MTTGLYETYSLSCALAIDPVGDAKPTAIGAEVFDRNWHPTDGIGYISSQLEFAKMTNYDYVIDIKIECRDPSNADNTAGCSSSVLVRLNRDSVVDQVGNPSRLGVSKATNQEQIANFFNIELEDVARHLKDATEHDESLYVIYIPYAENPSSARLGSPWVSHGCHQATMDEVRQCFGKSGIIYALVRQRTSPASLLNECNLLLQRLRKIEDLDKFYQAVPALGIDRSFQSIQAREKRPELNLPAQIIFPQWFQYATIMGFAAIVNEEEENQRFEIRDSKIRLASVPGSANRKFYGALRHNPNKFRLAVDDTVQICFPTIGNGEECGYSAWTAVVLPWHPRTLEGTISLLVTRSFDEHTGKWDPREVPSAIVGDSADPVNAAYTVLRKAPWIEVEYCDGGEQRTIINRYLEALQQITKYPNAWEQNALLGRKIEDQKRIDLYANVEDDEEATESLWLAMSKLNRQQAAALESTRSLPNGVGIVQGPPGTGKTFLISNMVQPLVFSEKRRKTDGPAALLLSTSNLSVDDIAMRVQAACDETKRETSSGREITVVRLHSSITERSIFFTHAPSAQKVKITDKRAKLMNYSLGDLMFQMSGFVESKYARKDQRRFATLRRELVRRAEGVDKVDRAMFEGVGPIAEDMLDDDMQFNELFRELRQAALKEADIVVATLAEAGNSQLYEAIFPEAIILDEASRATDAEVAPIFAWYPQGTKLFVGDSKQLQPVSHFNNPFRSQLALSAMSRLESLGYPVTMLVEQRRSVSAIAEVYSEAFYGGKLVTPASVEANLRLQASQFEAAIGAAYKVPNTRRSAILFKVNYGEEKRVKSSGSSGSSFNLEQVKVVMDAVTKLAHHGIAAARIAILVPYHGQLSLYTFARDELASQDASIAALQLETFDSVQGREFDFAIVDFVRTDRLGFLNEPSRVNVAVSRARYGLIVVLNPRQLSLTNEYNRSSLRTVRRLFPGENRLEIPFERQDAGSLVPISGLDEKASDMT